MNRPPPEALLAFLDAYAAPIRPLFLTTRARVLEAAPEANELIYDAYNALSCAYSFSDRLKEGFLHVAAYAGHVNLGFNRGAELDDPTGLLRGSGAVIRHVRLQTADDLRRPGLDALLEAAVDQGLARAEGPPATPASTVVPTTGGKRRP